MIFCAQRIVLVRLFIVKFSIHDNVHPLSHFWNSSSDARIGSTTRDKSVHRITSKFRVTILLFVCLSSATNAIENSVYFYVVISLHYTLHAFEHNFDRVFEESARLDIFRVYHSTRQNGFQMPFQFRANGVRTWRSHARIFRARFLQTLEPRDTCDCLLLIDNRRRLIRLCSSGDSINSSQRYIPRVVLVYSKQSSSIKSLYVVTCAVELTNEAMHLNLVIFIFLCALFLLLILHISCPWKNSCITLTKQLHISKCCIIKIMCFAGFFRIQIHS